MSRLWKLLSFIEDKSVEVHFMVGSLQRIEQAADRVVITPKGVIHDIKVAGTIENGVKHVAAEFIQRITVIATFTKMGYMLFYRSKCQ